MMFFSWHFKQYFHHYLKDGFFLDAYLLLSKQLIKRKSYQMALYLIHYCLYLEPSNATYHLMASKIYFAFQAFERGYFHASQAYLYSTHAIHIREHFIYSLIKTKRFDRAVLELNKLIALQDSHVKVYIQLAQISYKQHKIVDCVMYYQKAFELASAQKGKALLEVEEYFIDYLLIRFKMQSSQELLSEISHYLMHFKQNPYLHAFRAKLLSKEYPKEMQFHINQALKYGAHLQVVQRLVGLCYLKNQPKQGIIHLKKSLAMEPAQYQNLYDIAEAYAALHQKKDAIQYYLAFLKCNISEEEKKDVIEKIEALRGSDERK